MLSLNLNQRKHVSDLEKFFLVVDRMISSKIEENPKSGIVLNKGTDKELKVRYSTLKEVLECLHDSFAVRGCFSFGICETCDKFDNRGSTTKRFGKCNGKSVHCYDTCEHHSKDKGGFGL